LPTPIKLLLPLPAAETPLLLLLLPAMLLPLLLLLLLPSCEST
jgi:hypothetical protein